MLHHGQWRRWAWQEAFDGIIVHGLGSPTLLTRVAPKTTLISRLLYESTVWVLNTSLISSNFEKFSVPQGTEVFFVPETLPRMLKKHAAKDGVSPAMRRAKSERVSGILSLSLFLVRGRVSIETHAFFHLIKTAVFRPVVSRSAMSNKWIRESDDLL